MAQLTDEQLQDTNSVIANDLEAKTMRHKIENKDLLAKKGSLYVGTGNTTSTGACVTAAIDIPDNAVGKVLAVSESSDNGWEFVDTIANANHTTNADNIKLDDSYQSFKLAVLNAVYPIGSIYLSVNNASPQTFLGGTWESWGTGRVLVGVNSSDTDFNTAEKTGGEKTHTLNIDEIPRHDHSGTDSTVKTVTICTRPTGGALQYLGVNTYTVKYDIDEQTQEYIISPAGGAALDVSTGTVINSQYGVCPNGLGVAHNNLQPYITCFMWKRTA